MGAMTVDVAQVYDVHTQARARLFDAIRPLIQEQYTREHPFGHRSLRATMLEIARVEWLYATALRGEPIPGRREDWPLSETRQPTFADLEAVWRTQAAETRATFMGITDWESTIDWRIPRPGKTMVLSATGAQIAMQMICHEVHHRAQAMAMLRLLGVQAQNLDYILFVRQIREEPA